MDMVIGLIVLLVPWLVLLGGLFLALRVARWVLRTAVRLVRDEWHGTPATAAVPPGGGPLLGGAAVLGGVCLLVVLACLWGSAPGPAGRPPAAVDLIQRADTMLSQWPCRAYTATVQRPDPWGRPPIPDDNIPWLLAWCRQHPSGNLLEASRAWRRAMAE